MDAEQSVLYFERQQYNLNKLWLIYLLLGVPLLGIIVYSSFERMYLGESFSDMQETSIAFFLINSGILILLLIIPLFISALILTIQVYPDTIKIKLGPWLRRTVHLKELKQTEIINLNRDELLNEYGQRKPGWQLKSHNTYNVMEKRAVRLQLLNGTSVFIGSGQPEELQQILWKQTISLVKT